MFLRSAATCALLCASLLCLGAPSAHAQNGAGAAADALLGLVGASSQTLLPSDISRRLRDLDEENPFIELGVTYPVTGVRAYDRFFFDLAKVQGTIALAEHVIATTNGVLDDQLVQEVFSGDIFVDAFGRVIDVPPEHRQAMVVALIQGDTRGAGRLVRNMSSIQFRQARENFMEQYGNIGLIAEATPVLVSEVADLPGVIADLAAQTPDLVTDAPSAFAGANAVNAPRVASALAQAAMDLAELPSRVVVIGEGLAGLGQF